jgi:glycosyltransferase involved in cell wall biosynthesis
MDESRQPLVTVIAISYNHAPFIEEALASVFNQSYKNIELIIVDDASTDSSVAVIENCIAGKGIVFLKNKNNSGNCCSFNQAYEKSSGKYIIDFALDDLMYTTRIEKQVAVLEEKSAQVGVVFTNIQMIDVTGANLFAQYPKFNHKQHTQQIPEGWVFDALLSQYYINPVGMLFRREVIEFLNGYDETLAYEDFDFWIRSSKQYEYTYLPEILSAKRIVPTSLSTAFYKRNQLAMFQSTLTVCKKAWWLCITDADKKALVIRCRYEIRQAIKYNYKYIVNEYLFILQSIDTYFVLYNPFVRAWCWFKN